MSSGFVMAAGLPVDASMKRSPAAALEGTEYHRVSRTAETYFLRSTARWSWLLFIRDLPSIPSFLASL